MNLVNMYPYQDDGYLKSETTQLAVGGTIWYEAHPDEYEPGYVVMRVVEQTNGDVSVFRLDEGRLIRDLSIVDQDLLDYIEKKGDARFANWNRAWNAISLEDDERYLYLELKESIYMCMRALITKSNALESLVFALVPKMRVNIAIWLVDHLAKNEQDADKCRLLTLSANILRQF